jgi:hypothetical protein
MIICILLEDKMKPIPPEVDCTIFGDERIVDGDGNILAWGDSASISGDSDIIAEWLKPFDGIWTSNNPMMGDWKIVHVK